MSIMLNNVNALFAELIGVVSEFDEASGLGVVTSESMSELTSGIPFHCISIADGTRSITPGTRVRFMAAFRVKRVEAINLVNL
jgi:cold shock CspA family protein